MDLAHVPENADVWEKAVRKLRAGMMPPPGAPQPDPAAVNSFMNWMEHSLDEAAAAHPNPGRVALHRLNRPEYANAIEDLLGVKVNPAALLPVDDESDGFDNVASVLKVSPSFLDQYISAARIVSLQAIGNPAPKAISAVLRGPKGSDQNNHLEGMPLGTRGGMLAEHVFPADGEYEFNLGVSARFGMEYKNTVVMLLDGAVVFKGDLGGDEDLKNSDQKQAAGVKAIEARFQKIRLKVPAGPHTVGVTFVARTFAENDATFQAFVPGGGLNLARIGTIEVVGPFNPSGLSDTPSRTKIFICKPANAGEETACATKIFANMARRAYRRPVTDQDLVAPLAFFRNGRQGDEEKAGTFDTGIQNGLMAILSSPKFLYRAENAPEKLAPGAPYRISDRELASRLSFFLWSTIPDEELLNVANQGKLSDPKVLETQVRRMLADPKSESLVTNFASEWLGVRKVDEIEPDPFLFPNFDENLRVAIKKETALFVDSILRGDGSVLDFLDANYTFVNERLALHYGIPNVRGDRFRRVTLTDPNRRGLLGKASILMVTSYPNRTAPVLRGAWILDNLLGTPPHAPPPNVEALKENKEGVKPQTVRERMEEHRTNPSCNACHGIMDPLGLSLENFDAIGAWRAKDAEVGAPIDASGKLVNGTPVNSPNDLRKALDEHPDQFVETMTVKLMIYALGRGVEYYDMPSVRKIVRDASHSDYRFSSIVLGIVRDPSFQKRVIGAPAVSDKQQDKQPEVARK
jgi:hypothetical protein